MRFVWPLHCYTHLTGLTCAFLQCCHTGITLRADGTTLFPSHKTGLTLHNFVLRRIRSDMIWKDSSSQRIVAFAWNRDTCDPPSPTTWLIFLAIVFSYDNSWTCSKHYDRRRFLVIDRNVTEKIAESLALHMSSRRWRRGGPSQVVVNSKSCHMRPALGHRHTHIPRTYTRRPRWIVLC